MLVRNLMLVAGVLVAGATTAVPADAGEGRVGIEVGRGGIEVHADWGDRDHDRGRDRDHARGRRDHDRGRARGHARHVHGRDCRFIEGRFEIRTVRVWIRATVREEYVPPVYGTRYDSCGRPYRVLIRPGHVRRITIPGHFENRRSRVWVAGHWSCC